MQSFGYVPEGIYKIVWSSGVLNFLTGDPGLYGIDSAGHGYIVQYKSGTTTAEQGMGGPDTSGTSGEATSALEAAPPSISFSTTGETVGMYLADDPYWDNQGPGATFDLIKLPNPLPRVSISTVADPALLTQPTGDSVNNAFIISRSMAFDNFSTPLTVSLNPWLGTALQGDSKDYTLEYQPTGYVFPAGTPTEDQIPANVPTPPAPTEMSAGSVDIPANYSSVTVMAKLLTSAVYNPAGTIFGLLKASAAYALSPVVSGPAATTQGSTYTVNTPSVYDIGWIENTPGEALLNAVSNPAPPTNFAAIAGTPNTQTLSNWELARQYRDVLEASLSVTFDTQTGKVVHHQRTTQQQVGYTPLPGGFFKQGQGKMNVTETVTPDGKGVVLKALSKFRVAAFENVGNAVLNFFTLKSPHRLAWAWSEVEIEIDAGKPADVKFAGSYVPSQTYYIADSKVGGYSMTTNVAGVNQFLSSKYNSLGAGDAML